MKDDSISAEVPNVVPPLEMAAKASPNQMSSATPVSIVTPSAKSYERVTGRWVRDLKASSSREWTIYYIKMIVGTPIPLLLPMYAICLFIGRAPLEIVSWLLALLTAAYIFADRMSSQREFRFFRVGSDIPILLFLLLGLLGLMASTSSENLIAGLGQLRWILLMYLVAYCWELFPGLNRIFGILMFTALVTAVYAIWQHFSGVDLIRSLELTRAPIKDGAYFISTGFFRDAILLGTSLAMLLPFTAATFAIAEDKPIIRWSAFAVTLVFTLVIMWTYQTGMWLSALSGLGMLLVIQTRQQIKLLILLALAIFAMTMLLYPGSDSLTAQVQSSEVARSELQRAQINKQVAVWQENIWTGNGNRYPELSMDSKDGNVYFSLLAQQGILGLGLYFAFIVGLMMAAYRIMREIPQSHFWHHVFVAGGIGSQVAFHISGLYWPTLTESHVVHLFVLIIASLSYLTEHYERGLVPDDAAL